MKKVLFFAAILAAMTFAFVACDKKGVNEPSEQSENKDGQKDTIPADSTKTDSTIVFHAVGELRGVMFPVHNSQQEAVITLHPETNTVDVKFVQARIASEDETPQDIYIHNMPVAPGEGYFVHIELVLADGTPYAPFPKSYAFAALNPEHTTFNMHFGSDDESDTQVYLVFGAMLQSEEETANPLVGTWFYSDGETGDFHYEHTLIIGEENDFEYTEKALYDANNVHFGSTQKGTYEIEGNTVSLHFEQLTWHLNWDEDNFTVHTEQFTYTIEDNALKLTWLTQDFDRPTEFIEK